VPLQGFSDSSFAEEKDRKSVGGYVFVQANAAVAWRSSKQTIVAQSSTEAEYIALAEACKEAMWIRKMLHDFKYPDANKPTTIFEDNQSTIQIGKNPIHSSRTKHIDVKYHAVRGYIKNGDVEVIYRPTEEMTADIMTKSLGKILHRRFTDYMGLIPIELI